jgi:hypothetical protein
METGVEDYVELFEGHVDELCRLEQKAEKRAADLAETAKHCLLSNESRMSKLVLRMETVTDTIDKVNDAAEKIDKHINFCSQHVKLALYLFFGSLALSAVILVGSYAWFERIANELTAAKAELAQTNAKLAHKPLFLPGDKGISGNQNDYVRVVPNSEKTMTHQNGEPYPGVYAQVWAQ